VRIENFDDWVIYEPRATIPQQDNVYDCGVFMCQFAETLASGNDIQNICQADMLYYRKRMVLEIVNFNKHFDLPLL
jgi:sentrin-specific protease 1